MFCSIPVERMYTGCVPVSKLTKACPRCITARAWCALVARSGERSVVRFVRCVRNCRWDAYEIDNEGKNRGEEGGGKATAMGGL